MTSFLGNLEQLLPSTSTQAIMSSADTPAVQDSEKEHDHEHEHESTLDKVKSLFHHSHSVRFRCMHLSFTQLSGSLLLL